MTETSAIETLRGHGAEIAIILGSGLGAVVREADNAKAVAYSEFGEIPWTSVPGHTGRFVLGEIGSSRVIFAQGRVHLYEGHSARAVASIVRVLANAGAKTLMITNAAGALNPAFKPGDWMMISDHINLTGASPLVGTSGGDRSERQTPQFIDMTDTYSPRLRKQFRKAANKIGLVLHEGVYAAALGPQYETPAEVRMLQKLGADAVGMSTVLEAIAARSLGLELVGFSCLTNFGAGISTIKLTHEEVLATGEKAADSFHRLLKTALVGPW